MFLSYAYTNFFQKDVLLINLALPRIPYKYLHRCFELFDDFSLEIGK